ncbi:hypothetical protein [Paenibacillus hamazuiensis]|uniref:hypothetical protein n=1 Tax=Paenibacillus hamazuiensis TaxID=2936508 RepID=UPI00200D6A77|nr:hypothetical protein [Paenibacillus hamazuiensis]
MKFVTETRLKQLEKLLQLIPEGNDRAYAIHLLNSIRCDIDENYAEIQKPISIAGMGFHPRKKSEKRRPASEVDLQ